MEENLQSTANLQPASVIAQIFGVSPRRIEQLKAEGIIKGQGRPAKYDLLPTIKAYITYLADKAYGREKKQTDAQLMTAKLEAEKRVKTAKAEIVELELREMKGELHRAKDVEAITTDHVLFLRSMLMAMPGKLAVDCANCKTATEAAERIRREVYYVLERLTEYRYDPEEYAQRVRERRGWNGENDERDDEE